MTNIIMTVQELNVSDCSHSSGYLHYYSNIIPYVVKCLLFLKLYWHNLSRPNNSSLRQKEGRVDGMVEEKEEERRY